MLTAYFYSANGAPVTEAHFYAPGKFVRQQATARLERMVVEEECVSFHVGHGVYHVYVVKAVDEKTVLMERADPLLEQGILLQNAERVAKIWADAEREGQDEETAWRDAA